MPGTHTVREHEEFKVGDSLKAQDLRDLEAIQRDSASSAEDGAAKLVFSRKQNGALAAGKYVGVITTKRGTALEILPKIDLGGQSDTNYESTKYYFLKMLRHHSGLKKAAQLPESSIREQRRFPMLDVFVRQFLENLNILVRGGLARRYMVVEENLPYLRGRILFREQIRNNLTNQARFFVAHDEFSVNRPANRLICSALTKLRPRVQSGENRQLLRQLTAVFAGVPQTTSPHWDWREHRVDRSMRHYGPVMQWVGLFLFNRGLTTFAGRHVNLSLLFPMEKVFEDFVTHSFRRYQNDYVVAPQGPQKNFTQSAFQMKPDISLMRGNQAEFILDAKWKEIHAGSRDSKYRISQPDMYQLYAYGKRYGCRKVALVYPQTRNFTRPMFYQFFDGLTLICLPFDVKKPRESVRESIKELAIASHSRI